MALDDTDMELREDLIRCTRCEEDTPQSEVMELGSWWLCGVCYDDV